jgi:hypothetical protein
MNNWRAVAEVMEKSASKGTARLILIGIAAHINRETGTAYPGRERLAELANCHPDSVRKATHGLEALGELEVEIQGGPGASLVDKPNLYRIPFLSKGVNLASEDKDISSLDISLQINKTIYVKEHKKTFKDRKDNNSSSEGISSARPSKREAKRTSRGQDQASGPPEPSGGESSRVRGDSEAARRAQLEHWDRQASAEHEEAAREVQEILRQAIEPTDGRDEAKGSPRGVVRRPYAGQSKARRRRSRRDAKQ